jgi:hypothetical protein
MLTGQLWLFNKTKSLVSGDLHYTRSVALDITGTFNIEDNLNDTPSNAKFKTITTNTYREEFEVNTIAYHQDTDSWWVIKSDESTYINTGEYEHEIQLVELLEFYSYKHLPNCAFAPNTYTLEQMLQRLFKIGKQDDVALSFPTFLDKDKIMPFVSFENYTIANAIKNIARAINAIPKLQAVVSFSSSPSIWKVDNFILTFVNRSGLDTPIENDLNTQFPVAYEKNMNSSDQFLTRSVSNVTNAKSSNEIISPRFGGYNILAYNQATYTMALPEKDVRVTLPSKIEKINYLRVYLPIVVRTNENVPRTIYEGYYFDKELVRQKILNLTGTGFNLAQLTAAADNLPDPDDFHKVELNGPINKNYNSTLSDNQQAPLFKNKLIVKSKFDFDYTDNQDEKDRTIYWLPYSNELIMPLSIRDELEAPSSLIATKDDHNPTYLLYDDPSSSDSIYIQVFYSYTLGSSPRKVKPNEILVQAIYQPVADIKITIDNDNNAQDEKFFNQSGKVIDAVSVSKLITSHTNDSVEGTKIRNARYQSPDHTFNSILPLGQIIRDNNQLYIISQRSIDAFVKNNNEYYNVIYTLSRNRIARSENIIADSAVISYKTPDDNLVFRNQLYKDYLELSLQSIHNETPYLVLNKALSLNSTLAGTDFDYTVLAKNDYGSTPTTTRYVKNGTIFDLHKSKMINVNWQDNNVLGFRVEEVVSGVFSQTPIVYTDSTGKATNFELLFLTPTNLQQATDDFNSPTATDLLVPFSDLTQVPESYYNDDVVGDNRFTFKINETNYDKDPFEIPVFEYMVQANDDYNALGNIVVGNDLFTNFNGQFHYVINNTTRFTAENASDLWVEPIDQFQNSFIVTRSGTYQQILDFDLYADSSLFPLGRNEALIKNIGFYVKNGSNIKFLFAINDYVESGSNDKDDIRIFINNWKI